MIKAGIVRDMVFILNMRIKGYLGYHLKQTRVYLQKWQETQKNGGDYIKKEQALKE